MISRPLVKYVLMAAVRDKLMLALGLALILGTSLSVFLGDSALIEKDQFTVVFAASSLRIVSVLSCVLFAVFFVRRSFESKEIEYLLSRPVSRITIIFSFALSFFFIAFVIGTVASVFVYSVAPNVFGYGHCLWSISLIVELAVMINVALFFSMYISSSSSSAMASLGVYVLGRLMGQLLGIVDSPVVESDSLFSIALQMVSVITPRLDLLAQSTWLVYGVEGASGIVLTGIQSGVFILLVLSAACLDFIKRQF